MEPLKTQEDVLKLLERIENCLSDEKLASVRYQLRALLPECDESESLVSIYSQLMQSPEHYQIALSCVAFIVQGVCSKEQLEALQSYVKQCTKYESDTLLPKLQLRVLLADVAANITETEFLMNWFARQTLELHPDRFKASSAHCKILQLFELLEKKGQFGKLDKKEKADLEELQREISNKGRLDIANDITNFSSLRPFTFAVMDVELDKPTDSPHVTSGKASYRGLLIDTYKAMPEIPLGQWPPIRKVHYINLALITSDPMPRNDTFSRATVRGSVDDVMARKEPIIYEKVFPDKLLSKSHDRYLVLIEGRPACGKSTLLTKVSKDWADGKVLQDVELVILVRLRRHLGKKDINLHDLFGQYCANSTAVSSVIEEATMSGGKGICFLLDGLDEYGHLKDEHNLLRKLLLGQLLPNAGIVLASRPAGSAQLRNELKLQQHVEIIGFLEKEIKDYVESALKDNPHKARSLLSYLEKHPNIARMCYLPLHLAMVVYLFEFGQDLPDVETDLYCKFTLHTLRRSFLRESNKSTDSDEDDDEEEFHNLHQIPKEKKSLFESICLLAFQSTVDQKQIFTGKDILEMPNLNLPINYRKKAFDSLGLLTVDRIIADSSLPTKSFSFLHLTLQEFLSAAHMVYHMDEKKQKEVIVEHREKDHMWVVWKFYCGLASSMNTSPGFFTKVFHAISCCNISRRVAILNMLHCAFESKKSPACIDLVSQLKGILDVKDISLTPSDCVAMGTVASNAHSEMEEIDLSYCHIGPDGIQALVDQLHNPLKKVHLLRLRARTDHRPVGTKGAPALTKLLENLPNLVELRLYGNMLKTERFQYLVPVIRRMTNLQTLIVSRNDLDVDSGSHVSEILGNLSKLHTFYYNVFGDKGLRDMKPGLLKCQELKILGLRGTGLTENSGVHLSEILANLPKLEWLELYQNKLADKGVVDMLPGLRMAKSLQMISMVENKICDEGAIALSKYLEETRTLTEMRVYYNHGMTDVGKIAIRTAVVERPSHLCELREAV